MDSLEQFNINWFILFSSISHQNINSSKTPFSDFNIDTKSLNLEIQNNNDIGAENQFIRLYTELINREKFKNHKIKFQYILSSKFESLHKKNYILISLENFFNNVESDSSVFILSGNGGVNTFGKSYFVLETDLGDEKIYYQEIRDKWKNRTSKHTNKLLLIVIDALYSGGWVTENNENIDFEDIYIQASSHPHETSYDIQNKVGILIHNFIEKNKEDKFDIHKSPLQNPCYSGFYFKIKKYFNIEIMFNSWDDFYKTIKITKEAEGDVYDGDWVDNKMHGKGIMLYSNGDKFEGDWVNNKMQGKGIYYFYNGDKYEGNCLNGKMHGKGIYKFYNGDKYVGDWIDHKMHGKGTMFYSDGDTYIGDWINDKKCGEGRMYFSDGNRYEGEWLDDRMHGKGIFYYSDGDKYIGDWREHKMHGKGVYHYRSSGETYEGDWVDDKRHGKGTYLLCSIVDKYDGDWVADNMHGNGTLYYSNGDKYEGSWFDDKMHGKGIMFFSHGDKYEGDWVNDKMHGRGIKYYSNGDKYQGDWVNDKKHGKGIMYYSDGDIFEGDWVDNKKHGNGNFYSFSGCKYVGEWVEDVFLC